MQGIESLALATHMLHRIVLFPDLFRQQVPMVTLHFNNPLLDGAAATTFLLELFREKACPSMALYDHFHPPLSMRHHWHTFHNARATYLASDLNQRFPEGYFAAPNIQFGTAIDVAVLEEPLSAASKETFHSKANLHDELLRRLAVPAASYLHTELYALAYRLVERHGQPSINLWQETLATGHALPTMPLWLRGAICLAIALDATYERTCREQRIIDHGT